MWTLRAPAVGGVEIVNRLRHTAPVASKNVRCAWLQSAEMRFTRPMFVYAPVFVSAEASSRSPIRSCCAADDCCDTPLVACVAGTERPNVPFPGSPLLYVRDVIEGATGATSPRTITAP